MFIELSVSKTGYLVVLPVSTYNRNNIVKVIFCLLSFRVAVMCRKKQSKTRKTFSCFTKCNKELDQKRMLGQVSFVSYFY